MMYGNGIARPAPVALALGQEKRAGLTGTSWLWLGVIAVMGIAVLAAERKMPRR
jgi:hypothetical protein